jgi:phasin
MNMSTSNNQSKAKTTRSAAKSSESGADQSGAFSPAEIFAFPNQGFQTAPFADSIRASAEKSLEQARNHYASMKSAAEDATDVLENTLEHARQNTLSFNQKIIDNAKDNTDAAFQFWKKIMGVKTLSEAIELQTSFARDRFDALTKQTKDIQEFAKKAAEETARPVNQAVQKTMSAKAA